MSKSILIASGVRLRKIRSKWWLDVCRNYDRRKVNLRTIDEQEARDEARRLAREVQAGRLSWAALYVTPAAAADGFLAYLKQKNRAPRTVASTDRILDKFLDWLDKKSIKRLSDVQPETLDEYLAFRAKQKAPKEKTLSPQTANGELRRISAMFSWATARRRYLSISPAKGLEYLPVDPCPKRALRSEEIERIARVCSPILQDVIMTLANLGCRLMECLTLTGADVDLAGHELLDQRGKPVANVLIRSTKTRTTRRVPLNTVTREILARRRLAAGRFTNLLFRTPSGNPVNRANVRRDMIAAAKRAGVNVPGCTPHAIRRGFCTRLASLVPARALGYLVGHADSRTTDRWYRGEVAVIPPTVAL